MKKIGLVGGISWTSTLDYYKFINTTNNRQFSQAELLVMFNIAAIKGYYGKKVFYEPIYDEVTIKDPTADYRNTLYWKPDLITNEQGEVTVSFFLFRYKYFFFRKYRRC